MNTHICNICAPTSEFEKETLQVLEVLELLKKDPTALDWHSDKMQPAFQNTWTLRDLFQLMNFYQSNKLFSHRFHSFFDFLIYQVKQDLHELELLSFTTKVKYRPGGDACLEISAYSLEK